MTNTTDRGATGAPGPESPCARFLEAWLQDVSTADRAVLSRALDEIRGRIHSHWDDDPPALEGFWGELARCLPPTDPTDLPAVLARLYAVDLHLAYAARRGDARAVQRFERLHVAGLGSVVARVDSSSSFADEVKQRLRTKLLVAEGGETPKLAHYTGQGELNTWVRVVAIREALDSVRSDRRRALQSDDALLAMEANATGPEMLTFKQQYRAQFGAAFQDALAQLTAAQRNVLRLHYVHGLSIDRLGKVLQVHRSNAARRVAKARDALLSGTRRLLHARLSIDRREFDQLMALVASRIDLSIERFLGEVSRRE